MTTSQPAATSASLTVAEPASEEQPIVISGETFSAYVDDLQIFARRMKHSESGMVPTAEEKMHIVRFINHILERFPNVPEVAKDDATNRNRFINFLLDYGIVFEKNPDRLEKIVQGALNANLAAINPESDGHLANWQTTLGEATQPLFRISQATVQPMPTTVWGRADPPSPVPVPPNDSVSRTSSRPPQSARQSTANGHIDPKGKGRKIDDSDTPPAPDARTIQQRSGSRALRSNLRSDPEPSGSSNRPQRHVSFSASADRDKDDTHTQYMYSPPSLAGSSRSGALFSPTAGRSGATSPQLPANAYSSLFTPVSSSSGKNGAISFASASALPPPSPKRASPLAPGVQAPPQEVIVTAQPPVIVGSSQGPMVMSESPPTMSPMRASQPLGSELEVPKAPPTSVALYDSEWEAPRRPAALTATASDDDAFSDTEARPSRRRIPERRDTDMRPPTYRTDPSPPTTRMNTGSPVNFEPPSGRASSPNLYQVNTELWISEPRHTPPGVFVNEYGIPSMSPDGGTFVGQLEGGWLSDEGHDWTYESSSANADLDASDEEDDETHRAVMPSPRTRSIELPPPGGPAPENKDAGKSRRFMSALSRTAEYLTSRRTVPPRIQADSSVLHLPAAPERGTGSAARSGIVDRIKGFVWNPGRARKPTHVSLTSAPDLRAADIERRTSLEATESVTAPSALVRTLSRRPSVATTITTSSLGRPLSPNPARRLQLHTQSEFLHSGEEDSDTDAAPDASKDLSSAKGPGLPTVIMHRRSTDQIRSSTNAVASPKPSLSSDTEKEAEGED
jgi:hypothetical protein